MKIYMDVCCFNRPFDDQRQDRIYLESEAILAILSRCAEEWTLVSSNVVDLEMEQSPHREKLEKAKALSSIAKEHLTADKEVFSRARFFQERGIYVLDSLHLALAEVNRLDVLLTTDDRFLKAAGRIGPEIRVDNPVAWLMEATK